MNLSHHNQIYQRKVSWKGVLMGVWHASRGRSQLGDWQPRHGEGWLKTGWATYRPHEHARSHAARLGCHLPGGGAGDARHGHILGGHQGPSRLCLWSQRLPGVLKGPREDSVSSESPPTSFHPDNHSGATSPMPGSARAPPPGCLSTPTTTGSTLTTRLNELIICFPTVYLINKHRHWIESGYWIKNQLHFSNSRNQKVTTVILVFIRISGYIWINNLLNKKTT